MRFLSELAGLACIAVLVLIGADFVKAMSRPRLRRIIASGLVLLAAVSSGARSFAAGKAGGLITCARRSSLDTSPIWKRLSKIWAEAKTVAFGKRGSYPFNKAEKKSLLKAIDQALSDVASLAAARKIGKAESDALNVSIRYLRIGVKAKRPTERRGSSCYLSSLVYDSPLSSISRLTSQVPLIAKMARARRLQPPVVRKLVTSIERDLANIDDAKLGEDAKKVPPSDRAQHLRDIKVKAKHLRAAIRKDLKKIEKLCQ